MRAFITMADGDLNEEELLGNLSEYDSATKAADVLPHSFSVNKQEAPAFISPEQISSLTSAIQSLTERLVESPNATKGKPTKGKATAIKVTVYLQGCLASEQCSASDLNCRYLNPYIKLKVIKLAIKPYQVFRN